MSFLPDAVAQAVYTKYPRRSSARRSRPLHWLTISASIRVESLAALIAVTTEVGVGDDELVEPEFGVAADRVDDLCDRAGERALGERARSAVARSPLRSS